MNEYVYKHEVKGRDKVIDLVKYLGNKSKREINLQFTYGVYDINDGYIDGVPFEVKYRYHNIDTYSSQYLCKEKFKNLTALAVSMNKKMALYIIYLQDGNYLIYDLMRIDVTDLPVRSGVWSKVTSRVIENYELPNELAINIKID